MLTQRIIEYLFYLCIFILLFKFSYSATINLNESVATATNAVNVENPWNNKYETSTKRALNECDEGFSWMCLKIEFVKLMERLAEQDELNILPGVRLIKDTSVNVTKSSDLMADVARSYPNDPSTRLNGYILAKVSSFLQTHYLRFKLIDSNTVAEARTAVETGRGAKFGKKGGIEAIVAAGLMMKGTLMALGMGSIALLAGKALMTALMALTLSAVVGLKSLTGGGGGKSTTYEIVAKPIYTSSHSHSISHDDGHHGHSAYGRSFGGVARPESLQQIIN